MSKRMLMKRKRFYANEPQGNSEYHSADHSETEPQNGFDGSFENGAPGSLPPALKIPQTIALDAPMLEPWKLDAPDQPAASGMVWQDILRTGTVTLLYSKPKEGKSFLTMGLVAAMTRGAEFLGRPVARSGAVFVTEEGPEVMQNRIDNFGATAGELAYFYRFDPRLKDWRFEDVMANAAAVAQRDGHKLLILDTLHAWTSGEYNLETNPEQARVFFEYLRALAKHSGYAVLVLHHSKKWSIQARGWAALRHSLDTLIRLETPDQNRSHRVLHLSSHLSGTPKRIDYEYSRLGGFEAAEGVSAQEAVWRRLPCEGAGLTVDELMRRTGFGRSIVYRVLSELVDQERIKVTGEGRKGVPWRYSRRSESGLKLPEQWNAVS